MCFLTLPQGLNAKEANIAAIVNGQAILSADVQHRVDFAIRLSHVDELPAVRARMTKEILDAMIDEELMRQTAEKYKLAASPKEAADALQRLAQSAGMSTTEFETFLREKSIPQRVLLDQIKAQVGWRRYIIERYRGTVQISDADVALYKKKAERARQETRYHLGEIVFLCDPDAEAALAQAKPVYAQLKSGKSFEALAHEFSQSPSALNGGDLGFVNLSKISPELRSVVQNLQVGESAGPLKVGNTYRIIQLKDKYIPGKTPPQVEISLMKTIIPFPAQATQADLEDLLGTTTAIVETHPHPAAFQKAIKKAYPTATARTEHHVPFSGLHTDLQNILHNLKENEVVGPFQLSDSIIFFAVEKRNPIQEKIPTDDEVRAILSSERMSRLSASNIAALRRQAYTEKRI